MSSLKNSKNSNQVESQKVVNVSKSMNTNKVSSTQMNSGTKEKSASMDKIDSATINNVIKRYPSLTWREANERARILFYKNEQPTIHYNEKRDSFRVSMLKTDGPETKPHEVPVFDDDVRRLLNSCGLYWNGESISLLNKSDDIFADAQKEAFDILQQITNFQEN